jgi:hypothetical protein
MTRNRTILIMVGVMCVFLLSCSDKKPEGKTQENTDRWIYYGKTDIADHYYDKKSMTYVSPKVIKVWKKEIYSKFGKDHVIQSRKKDKQPIDGYNKLDFTTTLVEVDCMNNTRKSIKTIDYDDQGEILEDTDFQHPSIRQSIPESIGESLLREVCPK